MSMSDVNHEMNLAWDFVEKTGVNIFLTGKAGTGKTTFLKRLREKSPKRMIVVAPTGVAAINAEGVTIHSFSSFRFHHISLTHETLPTNTDSAKRRKTSSKAWICLLSMKSVWLEQICLMPLILYCEGIKTEANHSEEYNFS